MLVVARLVWLATGLLWAARSLVGFANPDYSDPVTALDWIAIARRRRLAGLAATMFLGILMFIVGGGFIILLALGGLAVAPSWFMAVEPTTDLADATLEVG